MFTCVKMFPPDPELLAYQCFTRMRALNRVDPPQNIAIFFWTKDLRRFPATVLIRTKQLFFDFFYFRNRCKKGPYCGLLVWFLSIIHPTGHCVHTERWCGWIFRLWDSLNTKALVRSLQDGPNEMFEASFKIKSINSILRPMFHQF